MLSAQFFFHLLRAAAMFRTLRPFRGSNKANFYTMNY